MMGILTKLFSSDTAIEKAADGVISGLDKVWHTKEEQSDAEQLQLETRKDFALKILELTKGSSPARREIAKIVMWMWLIVGLNLLVLLNLNIWYWDEPKSLTELLDWAVSYVATPSGVVLAFYFLKHILPSKA